MSGRLMGDPQPLSMDETAAEIESLSRHGLIPLQDISNKYIKKRQKALGL
jgi:hypothetical protein